MLWFFTRDHDSLQLETRYDNDTHEYVGTLTYPDGHHVTKRFPTAPLFRSWLVTVEANLLSERWNQSGDPEILLDGWPEKTPPQ